MTRGIRAASLAALLMLGGWAVLASRDASAEVVAFDTAEVGLIVRTGLEDPAHLADPPADPAPAKEGFVVSETGPLVRALPKTGIGGSGEAAFSSSLIAGIAGGILGLGAAGARRQEYAMCRSRA